LLTESISRPAISPCPREPATTSCGDEAERGPVAAYLGHGLPHGAQRVDTAVDADDDGPALVLSAHVVLLESMTAVLAARLLPLQATVTRIVTLDLLSPSPMGSCDIVGCLDTPTAGVCGAAVRLHGRQVARWTVGLIIHELAWNLGRHDELLASFTPLTFIGNVTGAGLVLLLSVDDQPQRFPAELAGEVVESGAPADDPLQVSRTRGASSPADNLADVRDTRCLGPAMDVGGSRLQRSSVPGGRGHDCQPSRYPPLA
jgi:hypothetical protein